MKKTAVESLLPYLKGARYISVGTTAVCFLMKNGKVLKVFLDTHRKRQLFSRYDNIIDHFDEIYQIKNDSFIVPEELLIKDGICVAYIYDYINARELKHLRLKTSLQHLIDAYDRLYEDTCQISDKKFRLSDVHDKNILFNTKYKIIDLDRGFFKEEDPAELVYKFNIQKINKTIIYSLLRMPANYEIKFIDKDLNELYNESLFGDERQIKELIKYLMDKDINTVLNIKLKSKQLVRTWHNDFYKDDE